MLLILLSMFLMSIYLFFHNKRVKDQLKSLPGPVGYPFVGNGLELSAGGPEDYFSTMCGYHEKYGNRCRIFLGEQMVVLMADPKDIEIVLSNKEFIEKSLEYRFFIPWLGTGLLTSTDEKWKKHRRVITPAFHFKILENFVQVFDTQSDIFIKMLSAKADNTKFDIYPFITLCALDIICESAMGVSVKAQMNSDSPYVNAVKNACKIINDRVRSPWTRTDLIFRLTRNSRVLDEALETLHGYTDSMIKQRKQLLENSNESLSSYIDTSENIYGSKRKMAFLDMLLLSTIDDKPLTDLEIREEVDTFLFEGHDTVSSAIGFTIYILSNNPDIQEKIFNEQMEIFKDGSRPVTYRDLQDMKYLDLVIKESLRLYPSVPLFGRKVNESVNINDLTIPKDTGIVILAYCMNRNPEIFPEPEKFIPERYLPDETKKRNPFSSVFFSAGPRNCIGQKFAMLEMKSTLSKFVKNFIVGSAGDSLVLSADIILKSVKTVSFNIFDASTAATKHTAIHHSRLLFIVT